MYSVKTETKPEKNILTIQELSDWLSISVSGLYHWVTVKEIPYFRVGRYIRFNRQDIEKWLDEKKVEARHD